MGSYARFEHYLTTLEVETCSEFWPPSPVSGPLCARNKEALRDVTMASLKSDASRGRGGGGFIWRRGPRDIKAFGDSSAAGRKTCLCVSWNRRAVGQVPHDIHIFWKNLIKR